jgi:rfaE bifunctional protein kinase chain/domain/rfaE bifunctional protein nucleotidyltransferase chain/domain
MLKNFTSKKIISCNLVSKFLKKIKKNKKIILCHGVFDLVHPGHIRHLTYAKNKGGTLVVSITSDRFINKGQYRPMVNQELRAFNLASLEVVDFVIIDDNPTPVNLIKALKPKLYIKGYEYRNKKNPKTKEEESLLNKFGGKIIFSPSDVVFSSTKIIKNEIIQDFQIEKLKFFLKENKITYDEIKNILKSFKGINVNIIGDIIIDQKIICKNNFTQNKTPTLSISEEKKINYIGGAAVVALHLKKAGANVNFFSFVGNDIIGKFAIEQLRKQKINLFVETFKDKVTNKKRSYYVDNYNLLKVSNVNMENLNNNEILQILSKLMKCKCNLNIFSDFRHGIFNQNTIEQFVKALPKKAIKIGDSQVASRWGNILDFQSFDLITPNEKEVRFSLGDQDSNLSALSRKIIEKSNCKNVIIKIGKYGAMSISIKKNKDYTAFSIPAFTNNVIDAVGTGDALLAYSSLTYSQTKCVARAMLIGSIAAACEAEIFGNIPISINQIEKKIEELKVLMKD